MAAGPSEFRSLLAEHTYAARSKKLFALGRSLKSQGLSNEELCRRLEALGPTSAFEELAVLTVARGAGAAGFPMHLLDHPSQMVRRAAVESGLLTSVQAKDAFLSSDTSRQMKSWLLMSGALPYDDEVLKQANHLFGKEAAWRVLVRASDAKTFEDGIAAINGVPLNATNLPVIARKFPEETFKLIGKGQIHEVDWVWFELLLKKLPEKVLAAYLGADNTSIGYELHRIRQNILSWGWRHAPEIMKGICLQNSTSTTGKGLSPLEMVTIIPGITSTDYYLTTNMKVGLLVEVFSQLPQTQKTPQMAHEFVKLFPILPAKRDKELQVMIDAWWKVVAELGRLQRKDALQWKEFSVFKALTERIPPPIAVGEFMKLLSEVDASRQLHQYMQSDVCTTPDGKFDELMGQVFEQYLTKEDQNGKQYVEMFNKLLGDCKSMDVIQQAFDALIWRLGNVCEHGLLVSVVNRMLALQKQYSNKELKDTDRKDGLLSIPIEWLQFASLPKAGKGDISAYIQFLHLTLHSGIASDKLLGTIMARYGRIFFWDAFYEVLLAIGAADGGSRKRKLLSNDQAPYLDVFHSVDVSRIEALPVPPISRAVRPKLSRKGSALKAGARAGGGYFDGLEQAKKETFGKCPIKREAGYMELVKAAGKEKDPKIFEDLLPFLGQRLNAEQDNIRANVMAALIDGSGRAMPLSMWADHLAPLEVLFKSSTKNLNVEFEGPRHYQQQIWIRAGTDLMTQELKGWKDGAEASQACTLALSFLQVLVEAKNLWQTLAEIFRAAGKDRQLAEDKSGLSTSAAKWVFERSLEVIPDAAGRLDHFFTIVQTMMAGVPKSSQPMRLLWPQWPFLEVAWRQLLAESVNQKCARVVLADAVKCLLDMQQVEAWREKKDDKPVGKFNFWFAPIEVDAFAEAVQGALKLIDDREIPPRDSASLLLSRIQNLAIKESMVTAEAVGDHAPDCNDKTLSGAFESAPSFRPPKLAAARSDDGYLKSEIAVVRKLLKSSSGADRRAVLWSIADVADRVRGPNVAALLEDAIAALDAQNEGMARCIGKQFPYLEAALSSTGGTRKGDDCDVLTPLLEAWLSVEPAVCEERIGKIMSRKDSHVFLFFGARFSEFLSNYRQDWLHQCVQRLVRSGSGSVEFYHYTERGPWVGRLALFGKGWKMHDQQTPNARKAECVQTKMWHKDTQAQFLDKALGCTDLNALSLLARLDYIDCTVRAAELLGQFPKTQEGPVPDSGFVVVQPTGTCENAAEEVERRFLEAKPPGCRNAVDEREVEQILTALGFADNSIQALRVLGEYAGKVKRAKDAVIRAVPNLSPMQARVLVRDVMLGPKAGVSLCVAAIRQIADLQMPNPMELYQAAWRGGKCHRDIAANILSRLATSPLLEYTAEEARPFFDFFTDQSRAADHEYVAQIVLQLGSRWVSHLPFFPDVVVDHLLFIKGQTTQVQRTLQSAACMETEIVKAYAKLLQHSRFALRAAAVGGSSNSKNLRNTVLTDLASFYPARDVESIRCVLDRSTKCSYEALQAFLQEFSFCVDAGKVPKQNFVMLWARLLRPDNAAQWQATVAGVEKWIADRGDMTCFKALAQELVLRVTEGVYSDKTSQELKVAALSVLVPLFERILDSHLSKGALGAQGETAGPHTAIAVDVFLEQWAKLVAHGCSRTDAERIFARCPQHAVKTLTLKLVNFSIQAKVPDSLGYDALKWATKTHNVDRTNELVDIVAALVAKGFSGSPSFEEVVQCLQPLSTLQSARLVMHVLDVKPKRSLARSALTWLSKVSVFDAVGSWPVLFDLSETVGMLEANPQNGSADDVVALLQLCKAAHLDLPVVQPRTCPVAAVPFLVACELPSARVLAVQIIQERELIGQKDLLAQLKLDQCPVVHISASHVWAALFAAEEKAKAQADAAENADEDVAAALVAEEDEDDGMLED